MELKDTVEMMNSNDYKERFKAEYYQLVIRYRNLESMLVKWDEGTINFDPICPRSTYNMQTKAMADYIAVLEARAAMEGIDLHYIPSKNNECEKVEIPIKRTWSGWYLNEIRFTDLHGKDIRRIYSYRTNGKKVQVRCGAFKAEASCCKNDKFEFEKGLQLAKDRLIGKWIEQQIKSITEGM